MARKPTVILSTPLQGGATPAATHLGEALTAAGTPLKLA